MTDREHLLTRCLRLEERVHALECQLRRAGLTPRRLVTAAEAARGAEGGDQRVYRVEPADHRAAYEEGGGMKWE